MQFNKFQKEVGMEGGQVLEGLKKGHVYVETEDVYNALCSLVRAWPVLKNKEDDVIDRVAEEIVSDQLTRATYCNLCNDLEDYKTMSQLNDSLIEFQKELGAEVDTTDLYGTIRSLSHGFPALKNKEDALVNWVAYNLPTRDKE